MNKNKEATFRAWDDYDKKYLDFGEFGIYDIIYGESKLMDEIYGKKGEMNEGMPNERLIFEQYTGFKDNNEKKIFEGDIVKIAGRTDNDVVIFKDGAFCIEGWTNTLAELMTDWSFNIDPTSIEVIGNIRENPELLKDN